MTDLKTLLSDVQHKKRRFVVYSPDSAGSYEEWFANHNVDIEYRPLPTGSPTSFLVVERGESFAGAIGLDDLEYLLEPPIVRPERPQDLSEGYRIIFEILSDTVFTAMTRRELLAVSREIEERAYRVGTGVLHASFQKLSTFESQTDVYRHLATETDLEIHIYGLADWDAPEIPQVTYHGFTTDPLEQYWALAFDGGKSRKHACGLLARECSTDAYVGFWTDEPAVVQELESGLTKPP
ncbi:DICT sensory domain-containing protein [Halobellus captivus]|uniref:DICT sensory domain-containing protein n=1 Tax=Halobellus captivus TaxID=2592614 RepID=UPI001EF021B1|nr:DICT sensory domain-containing protein [Halobellus captivus]